MISIRRGDVCVDFSWANSGTMQSSIGSARQTPAPRRNERRGSGRTAIWGASVTSVLQENPAADQRVYQIARAITIGGAGIEHALNLRPIRKAHRCSGGVDRQLPEQIARQLPGIFRKNRLEIADIAETPSVD